MHNKKSYLKLLNFLYSYAYARVKPCMSSLFCVFFIILSSCNVAEQKDISNLPGKLESTPSKFDLYEGKTYIKFKNPVIIHQEQNVTLARVEIEKLGDLSSSTNFQVQFLESLSNASLSDDINIILDTLGSPIIIPSVGDPIINYEIPAGENSTYFDISINNDNIYELEESLIMRIINPSGLNTFAAKSDLECTLRIQSDDLPPATSISNPGLATTSTIAEGSSAIIQFNQSLRVSNFPITYNLSYSGSANTNEFTSNYPVPGSPLPRRVIAPALESNFQIQITPNTDTYAESTETLTISIDSVSTVPNDQIGLSVADLNYYNQRQTHTLNVTDTSGGSNAVNITSSCPNITENDPSSACTVAVTLAGTIDSDAYVDLVFSGTAQRDVDFTSSKSRLYFAKNAPAGQVRTFTIRPIDDQIADSDTITITLNPSTHLSAGASSSTNITIIDNEAPLQVGFALSEFNVLEGQNLSIPVVLNSLSESDVVVNYSISTAAPDSATIGVDHNLNAIGTFTVSAGEKISNTTFKVFNDAFFDDREKIYLTLTGVASGGAALGANTLEINIREAGPMPILNFTTNTQVVTEGSLVTVTLRTDKVAGTPLPYTLKLVEVTSSSSDYSTFNSAILTRTFPAGSLNDSFTIQIDNDTLHEPVESFVLIIETATDMAVGQTSSQAIDIRDNSAVPQLDMTLSALSQSEGNSVDLNFTLAGGLVSGFDLIIPYTVSGTSITGVDHTLFSSTIFLPRGTNSTSVQIDLFDDNLFEGSETIIIDLTPDPTKYILGSANQVLTITDAQTAPTVSFGGSTGLGYDIFYEHVEGDIINIPLELDYPSASDIDIIISVEDKWDNANNTNCEGKCANIFNYESIHEDVPLMSAATLDNLVSEGPVVGTNTYRIEFSAVPTLGGINISFGDNTGAVVGSINISAGDISGATIEDVCENLVSAINEHPNAFIRSELYAFHKNNTNYVSIRPRPLFLDTDLDQQMNAGQIEVTIPAGNTQALLSFNALDDRLYESSLTEHEYFRVNLLSASGGTLINAAADQALIEIEDVHSMPRAQFIQKAFARTEPSSESTAVISIPIYLSNFSEVETEFEVVVKNDPLSSTPYADENDFIISDTLTRLNLEASSIYERVPGTVSGASGSELSLYPRYAYNETEIGHNIIQDGYDATFASIERVDGISEPNNGVTRLTFNGAGNSGSFDLLGTDSVLTNIDVCNGAPPCSGLAAATNVETFINTNLDSELIAVATGVSVDFWPLYLPALKYDSQVIKTFRIRVPAGQNIDYIPVEILNDNMYEGTEKFSLTLSQITVPSLGAEVNTSLDSAGKPNNIAEVFINDDDGVTQITISSDHGLIENEGTPADRADIAAGTYTFNDVEYTVTLSPPFQTRDLTFEVIFSGDMIYMDEINSPEDFMRGDFGVDLAGSNPLFSPDNLGGGRVEFTYPAGLAIDNVTLMAQVHEDYRNEDDETLTASIGNNDGGSVNSESTTSTLFQNDDAGFTIIRIDGDPIFPQDLAEYESQLPEFKFYLTDDLDTFYGADVSEVPVTMDYTIVARYRHSGDPDFTRSGEIRLFSGNNYRADFEVKQSQIGDFRSYESVTLNTDNFQNAQGHASYGVAAFSLLTNLTVPDLIVKANVAPDYSSDLAAPLSHTCTVHRGLVSCFGSNSYGQLGRGSTVQSWGADQDIADQDEVVNLGINSETGFSHYALDIALGRSHTCALLASNQVKCWGRNDKGQLGLGSLIPQMGLSPGQMGNGLQAVRLGEDDKIHSIHTGADATCAFFKDDGYAKCWGSNEFGQLGIEEDSTTVIGDTFSEMGANLKEVMFPDDIDVFAMGAFHACAKGIAGERGCWGKSDEGQLGTGPNGIIGDEEDEMANLVLTADAPLVDFALGPYHTCLYRAVGGANVSCFGSNSYGQLAGAPSNSLSLSAGRGHSCASFPGPTRVRCWGSNSVDKRVDFVSGGFSEDLGLLFKSGVNVDFDFSSYDRVDVTSGAFNSCAAPRLTLPTHASGSNNEFICWGTNYSEEIGLPNSAGCNKVYGSSNPAVSCNQASTLFIRDLDYEF